uniref:Protein arginine methyltransferase NDUFAF7 n=1 Tax=Populus trichocarpa TaxID=3694 RepID=A0A2K2C8N5_POPTR
MEMRESQSTSISIDRSALYNPPGHSHEPTSESELFRGGSISVAEYMEEVLMNPKFGFYINRDVFGVERDFITSPEVSQMFGEMVVNLVELGAGRGTLMADLLRGASKFKSFTESLHVHMVECSSMLQKTQ